MSDDIEALAAQIAAHLEGETVVSVDAFGGVHDIGDVLESFAEVRLKQACALDGLTSNELRHRLDAVSELCRELVSDKGQPAPVRALAVRVLEMLSRGE